MNMNAMNENVIIFGCGNIGTATYYKIRKSCTIVAWADNNPSLWGKEKNGIPVIAPSRIPELFGNRKGADILVAVKHPEEILKQLKSYNLLNICIWNEGFIYREDGMLPIRMNQKPFRPRSHDTANVLFVQTTACIRTHKIANAVKKAGNRVFLAYSIQSPKESIPEYADVYEVIFPIMSMQGLVDFVNQSDFDYIHSSNEPDYLTALLTATNKTVIHDCHDMSSAYKPMTPEEMTLECLANTKADGVIYTSEGIRHEAIRKFGLPPGKTHVLENLITEELRPSEHLPKRSRTDGKLHCVYEGGVLDDAQSHRFFEIIWIKLAKSGVHIHFYTTCRKEYCRYLESLHGNIHYEGNRSSKQLSVELSQYDVGLCMLNITDANRQYLEYASPNKIQEYINAGIPVAVSGINAYKEYVEGNGFGKEIRMDQPLLPQLRKVSDIKIEDDILRKKGLTLESKIDDLMAFYQNCSKKSIR